MKGFREPFHRVIIPHTLVVYHLRKPFGSFNIFPPFDDGSSTFRAKLLVLPDSSVQATPVQDFMRLEDSENLVGFKEKILRSSEEFHGTVASEGLYRVHIDPALMLFAVGSHFILVHCSKCACHQQFFAMQSVHDN